MSELGYGAEYRYAHDEPGAYAAGEQYFPPELAGKQYYQPTDRGLEKQIAQKLDYLHELDRQSRGNGTNSDAMAAGSEPLPGLCCRVAR